MSSSRIRLYLDLKLSPLELSRWRKLPYGRFTARYALNPARYLKEMTSKWSIFEKPYLDNDGPRAMNFRMPTPDWPSDPKPGFGGGPGLWTFRFAPGICYLSVANPECGIPDTIRIDLGLVPPGHDYGFSYAAESVMGEISILDIEYAPTDQSATIHFLPDDEFEGETTICAKAYAGGQIIEEFTVISPFSGPTGILSWVRAMALPPAFQVSTTYYGAITYDCGCRELDVFCDLCDDTGMSWSAGVVSIGQSDSVLVTITDTLNKGGPYTWSVGSGTGFSWQSAVTTGKSNYLETTGSACGTAVLTVTGCDGNAIQGYAKCSAGQWSTAFTISGPSAGCGANCGNCCCLPYTGCSAHSTALTYEYFNTVNRVAYPGAADWCYGFQYCIGDPELCPDATGCVNLTGVGGTYSNSTGLFVDLDEILRLKLACGNGYGSGVFGCWEKNFVGQEWVCVP